MSASAVKDKINAATKRSCLPGAREVYVRHINESVALEAGESPWGGICHLIHPDVTVAEFFSWE